MTIAVRNQADRRLAFTLIELLVVIGIIALLIGILLPSLAASREEGRQVVCMTRLDQIFGASFMYASENEDHLPLLGFAPGHYEWMGLGGEWWPIQIQEMLNSDTNMYACPSDMAPYQEFEVICKLGGTLVPADNESDRFPLKVTYKGSCTSAILLGKIGAYHVGRRISDWADPSKALMLVEGHFGAREEESDRTDRECFRFDDLMRVGSDQWYNERLYVDSWERHNGSTNILFVDGGFGRYRPEEVPGVAQQQEYWEQTMERRKPR